MEHLSAHDIVGIWERGQRRPPAAQALIMLAAAHPDRTPDELGALSLGERDARLLALRELTFGPQLSGYAECPRCGERLELALDARELRDAAPDEPDQPHRAAGPAAHTFTAGGYEVRFRLLTTDDLAAAAAAPDVERARDLLVQRCVLAVRRDSDGQAVSAGSLPEAVVAGLAERLAECDPLGEIVLDVRCPHCGHRWSVVFDVASFFWTELSGAARRLLREVHTLATAYGWSESTILALSSQRRQAYLDMAGVVDA
jgi:DNA-directed RNA polymerase subunit RPC12/RpoP